MHVEDVELDRLAATEGVDPRAEGQVERGRPGNGVKLVGGPPVDSPQTDAALGELHRQVRPAFAHPLRRPHELAAGDGEDGPAVALAEGCKPKKFPDDRLRQRRQRRPGIDRQARHEIGRSERVAGDGVELVGESFKVGHVHPQAGGHGVPAETLQERRARLQGLEQAEPRNRPARTLAIVFLGGDEHGRAVILIDEPRGDDADDAGVPLPRCEHQGVGQGAVAGFDHFDGLLEYLSLNDLPATVLRLELPGDLVGLLGRGFGQQPERVPGVPHPTGGVQARADDERHVAFLDALVRESRRFHDGLQPRVIEFARQGLEPRGHERPVFVYQRHDVGDGSQGGQRGGVGQELLKLGRAGPLTGQRQTDGPGQLKGHAHAGQVAEGVGRVGQLRIDDGVGLGQPVLGFVVIGDDEIDAQRAGPRRLGDAGDAAIDRDDHRVAVGGKLLEGRAIQTVPFLDAVRHIERRRAADKVEALVENGRGREPVDVIITVDGDLLVVADRADDTLGGFCQIRHLLWAMQLLVAGMKKFVAGLGRGQPPVAHDLGQQGTDTDRVGEFRQILERQMERPAFGHLK